MSTAIILASAAMIFLQGVPVIPPEQTSKECFSVYLNKLPTTKHHSFSDMENMVVPYLNPNAQIIIATLNVAAVANRIVNIEVDTETRCDGRPMPVIHTVQIPEH